LLTPRLVRGAKASTACQLICSEDSMTNHLFQTEVDDKWAAYKVA